MNTTTQIIQPRRSSSRAETGRVPPVVPDYPTFAGLLSETLPLIGAVFVAGPPVVFVGGPLLLFVLMLLGPVVLLFTLVAMLVAATGLLALPCGNCWSRVPDTAIEPRAWVVCSQLARAWFGVMSTGVRSSSAVFIASPGRELPARPRLTRWCFHRAGYSMTQAQSLLRDLPDPIDFERDGEALLTRGLSLDGLISERGAAHRHVVPHGHMLEERLHVR
jgi:hypothetical protein